MQPALMALAFAAGFVLTIQVGLNAAVRTTLQSAGAAAFVNFGVGLIALFGWLIVTRVPVPDRSTIAAVPGWAWFGGCLGAFYVVVATVAGPRLGAATLLALTVLGQLAASLLVDHYGWLGFPQHSVNLPRVLGCALLLAGVWLVSRN